MSTSAVIVRRATVDDYEAVLDINRHINEGYDYMSALYFTFLQDKKHVMYVLELDGLLISLINYEFGSDDSRVSIMSSRVRPSHQGRGLSIDKSEELKAIILKEYPKLTHEIFTFSLQEKTKRFISEEKILYRWNSNSYKCSINALLPVLQQTEINSNLIDVSYSTAVSWLMNDNNILEAFFRQYADEYIPTGPNWKPYKLTSKLELKNLFATHRVFVTRAEIIEEKDDNNETPGRMVIRALSYCFILRIGERCRLDIYYYGDVTDLCAHVCAQLLYASTVWNGELGIALHFVRTIEFSEVDDLPSIIGHCVPTGSIVPFQMYRDAHMLSKKLVSD